MIEVPEIHRRDEPPRATVARRRRGGDDGYIGSITASSPHDTRIALDFLEPGKTYNARIFADGEKADYRTDPYPVDIYTREVTAASSLDLHLAPGGGAAVILTPVPPEGSLARI